MIVFVLGTTYF